MGTREIEIRGYKLIIQELDYICDSFTGCALTGSWLWDSALILAQYISTHLQFKGKSVLELGAGAGLPGLTAASLGAAKVLLTDISPLLPRLMRNVEANGFVDTVQVRELVWGSDDDLEEVSQLGEYDFVLMSDVFFDCVEMLGLGKTLKKVCGRNTEVWAVSEVRPSTCECLNQLLSQGFGVIELPSEVCDGFSGKDKSLMEFAVYQLIPPIREICDHMADTGA